MVQRLSPIERIEREKDRKRHSSVSDSDSLEMNDEQIYATQKKIAGIFEHQYEQNFWKIVYSKF